MSTNPAKSKNYAIPIGMMFLLFFIISFVTGLQNPLANIVKTQFGLSVFESQLGNMAVFLAYLFMGIPAGMIINAVGYKKTAFISLIIGFLGVLVMLWSGYAVSFPIYLIGAFISGFCMCMLNTVVNPMLSVLGKPEGANQRLNFGGAINSIGATLAPVLGGLYAGGAAAAIIDTKPVLYISMGIFVLVFIVLFIVEIPEPHLNKDKVESTPLFGALSFRHFILGMVAIFLYVGTEVTIANLTMSYLTKGLLFDDSIAGGIVGVYWLLMLVGRLLGGVLGSKFTSKQMLIGVASAGIILIISSILLGADSMKISMPGITKTLEVVKAEVPFSIILLILCGLCTSVMWAGIYNLATSGLGKYTVHGSGFFMTMVFGGGIIPLIQGNVADHIGYQASYWVPVACLCYILFYAIIGCKNVNKNIEV